MKVLGLILILAFLAAQGNAQQPSVIVANAATYSPFVTADSIATAGPIGGDFSTITQTTPTYPIPFVLGGVRVRIADIDCGMFYVSPKQINFHIPASAPPGLQRVEVYTQAGVTFVGSVFVAENVPAIFTVQSNGQGDASAYFIPVGGLVYAVLFGTGFGVRVNAPAGAPETTGTVELLAGGKIYPATYCGPAPVFTGLQQVNAAIPATDLAEPISAAVKVCNQQGTCWLSNAVTLRWR